LLEHKVVTLHLAHPDEDAERIVDALRYVLSFARLTAVRTANGADVDVSGLLGLHANQVRDELTLRVGTATSLWEAVRALPDLTSSTRRARKSVLEHLPIDRESLEDEVTTRKLAVVSGGGGGAGYVYPGCYEELERSGLVPDLMIGTSIGALMSMFRARRRRYDPAPMVQAGRNLAWSNVFRVLETHNRYGLPATLRLYLRAALGTLFQHPSGTPLRMSDMEIPLFVMTTGITVEALKHDLDYYEHLLDFGARRGFRARASGVLKTIAILKEFLSRQDALVEVVLGRAPGTQDFDVLDAAGFSASIPGVIHYDVLRDDPHMKRVLDTIYAEHGITRLGEGGMVANVPARVAWETITSGALGRRNSFVLALDCFAPNPRALVWYPLQQAVRSSNVDTHRAFADVYVPLTRTLSPMNLVPPVRDFLMAMRWGRESLQPHMPLIKEMMRRIQILSDAST
jgi:predicted acylesterase/phospholipase RssA